VPVVLLAFAAALAAASGPQTAHVVGLPGEQLTTERNHAVKVQFAWKRGAKPNAGGLTETGSSNSSANTQADPADLGNAPGNASSGTWLRVAEALAGPDWDTQFTPRLGTEVLVDFIVGDLD
jgi:type VI secretion system secreted protein VgrG